SIWCTSLVFCVAADTTGHIATSTHPTAGASSWSISAVDPSTVAITAVDCPSNTFCMALDSSGAYLDSFDPTGGTTAWNTPTSSTPTSVIDAANILNSLSCPSTYLCLATDQAGDILVANANLPLSILTTSLPSVNEGNPYSQSLSAIGGNAPYAWSIASGSLPTGLTLTSAGTISGSPVTSGIATFVIRVADSSVPSQSAIKQLTIDVNSTQLAVTTTSLPSGNLDTSYSAVLGESGGSAPYTWSIGGGLLPTGLLLSSTGSIFGTPTISGSFSFAVTVTDSSVPPLTASAALVVTISSTPNPTSTQGYWLGGNVANSNGSVFAYGSLTTYPGTATLTPGESVVGIAGGPQSQGYWLATSTGGVFSFGSALFYGSMGGTPLFQPVVGMTSTPDGLGYWLVAADGGIFAFGDAVYYGSTGGRSLVQPIVGMASTPDGHGYWLVAADGGIFAFGDAGFYGSAGGISLAKPVSAMASTPDGHGYWLVGQDGGIFPYGDAGFFGSGASLSRPIAYPVVGILGTPDGLGYWMVSSDGGVFAFGDATFNGSKGVGSALIIGIAN
ncbi:MAG TPA: Ig domain-containing protein, partial [Acidimicrobiales bacterium]|nr:Ig domain-containing protein [Acidimicrobiales bacterium]